MDEPRRVQLTTISGNIPLPPAAPKPALIPMPAAFLHPAALQTGGIGHTGDPSRPTDRFVITLFESDDRRCSEFWYPELANKQNILEKPGLPSCLEKEGRDKELQAIARTLEEKYGGGGRKKIDRIQDLVDIGQGYEEDSFIDNSEPYDELVPSSLTTQHGGFYINTGTLQFRRTSDTETDDDFATEKTTKKRQLQEGEEEKPRKKKKRRNEESGQMMVEKKKKKKREEETGQMNPPKESDTVVPLGGGGEEKVMKTKKKKKPAGPLSVTNMLRKFRKQKEREKEQMERETEDSERLDHTYHSLARMPLGPADAAGGVLGLADPLLSLIDLTDDSRLIYLTNELTNDNALLQAASTVDFLADLDSLLDTTMENPPRKEANPDRSMHNQGHTPELPTQNQTGLVTLPKSKCLPMAIPQNQIQNQAQPPVQNQSEPAYQNQAEPPTQNQSEPAYQNQAEPPTLNQAESPNQNQAEPPTQNQADPPTQKQAEPQNQNQAEPPNQNQAQNQAQLQTSALTVSEAELQSQPPPTAVPVAKANPSSTPQTLPQPLPEGLPPALERSIGQLALAARNFVGENKVKFFTPEVNSNLLDVEQQSRDLAVQVRSKVYTHLASFLPCSKHTLLKRAKKLLLLHVQEDPLLNLREAIIRAMPEQISRYHNDCQSHTQARVAKLVEEEKEREQKEEGKEREPKENGGRAEEEEEKKSGKRVWGPPRKTFRWNEEIRECLCSVVRVKMNSYQVEKDQNQIEECLKTFLNDQVKPLWPNGWMQPSTLLKESRRVLSEGASHGVKRKVKTERRQSSLNRAPTPPEISRDPLAVLGSLPTNGPHLLGSVPAPMGPLELDASLDGGLVHTSPPLVAKELAAPSREEEMERRGDGGDFSSPIFVDTLYGAAKLACVEGAVTESHPSLSVPVEKARDELIKHSIFQKLQAAAELSPQQSGRGLGMFSPPSPPPPPQSSPELSHFQHSITQWKSIVLEDGPSSQWKLH